MTSAARANFIQGIASLDETLEESWTTESTARGAFVRRGLTVASFNLLETFLMERLDELAKYLNGGNILYSELPPKMQLPAAKAAIEVAANRVRRIENAELRDLVLDLSQSLTSPNSSQVSFSVLSFLWKGSNMSDEDYKSILSKFHVADPYAKVRELTGRLGFPARSATTNEPLMLREDLKQLATERHRSAHESSHSVSTMWLKTVSSTLLRFGVGFDVLASIGAANLRSVNRAYVEDEAWNRAERVDLKIVVDRGKDYAVVSELGSRAKNVSADGDELFRKVSRGGGTNLVVARFDSTPRLMDWAIPNVS